MISITSEANYNLQLLVFKHIDVSVFNVLE